MSVNGNNDKQLRYKLINLVRLLFLIPLSFTFDNPSCHLLYFKSQTSLLSVCSMVIALCVPADGFLFGSFLFYLYTVKAMERGEDGAWRRWSVPPICFQYFNITGRYFPRASFIKFTVPALTLYTCRLLLALRLNIT